MNKHGKKRVLTILFFILISLGGAALFAWASTYYGDLRTGLIELENYKYPVYLYVPDDVKPGKKYPLVISIPDQGEKAEDNIKKWMSLTQVRTVLILVPTYLRPEDVPDAYNRWFFQIKNLVSFEFPVNRQAVYLVGQQGAAPYAAYLGVNFPDEFAAVAILDGPLVGPFDELWDPQSRPSRQVPIYIGVHESRREELLQATKQKVYDLENRGYHIEFEIFDKDTDFYLRDFNKKIFEWLMEKGEDWREIARQDRMNFRDKIRRGIKDFFTV